MKDIKFNLVHENEQYIIYKNYYYKMGIEKSSKKIQIIRPIEKNYLPYIRVNYNISDFKFKNIEIQTSSCGAVSKEKIIDIIESYNIAIKTVEEIEKNFVN